MQDASKPIWFKKEEVKTGEITPQRTIQTDFITGIRLVMPGQIF